VEEVPEEWLIGNYTGMVKHTRKHNKGENLQAGNYTTMVKLASLMIYSHGNAYEPESNLL
jgi:hypothetical protein